jgi:hypothetical protein
MTTPTPADADARAVETAWRIHTELGNWTAKVDAKASFALTLESAATAGVIALSTNDHVLANLHGWVALLVSYESACSSAWRASSPTGE